jgi:uncharacterized protein YceH (UPF0502 family)
MYLTESQIKQTLTNLRKWGYVKEVVLPNGSKDYQVDTDILKRIENGELDIIRREINLKSVQRVREEKRYKI